MLSFSLFILLTVLLSASCVCPPEESISPFCICKDLGNGPMLLCNNIMATEELIPLIKSTEMYPMFSLTLMDSALPYIPSTLFEKTRYQKIAFVNTQIMSLSDEDLAFVGLEGRLEEVRATDAKYIAQWDWSQLRNQQRLELIDINLMAMNYLDQEFPPLRSLRLLGITKAEISFLHPTAFSKLESLKILDLRDNLISEMSRAMLPNPAEKLSILQLSGNQLSSLPEDMFEGMPSLKELELNYNKFATLNEEVFLWPLENLQLLHLKGNEIRCDCLLKWMVNIHKPLYFEGSCHQPEKLKGLSLKNIANSVLWCT